MNKEKEITQNQAEGIAEVTMRADKSAGTDDAPEYSAPQDTLAEPGESFDGAEGNPLEWGVEDEPDGAQTPGGLFVLKHLGLELTVNREAIIPLAQKGLDYDRIRDRLDDAAEQLREAREHTEMLRAVAAERGMTLYQFVDTVRANRIASRDNISVGQALSQIRRDRAARERLPEEIVREKRRSRNREIEAFAAEYGADFDPKTIPAEVWDAVKGGKALLEAYRQYETEQLRGKVADMEKRGRNALRSTGSRTSDGAPLGSGEIESDWYGGR
ncbi:MAG: hypothetical protein LBC78_04115 [Oscillospiraceae bacterium]|nr:hypothetical protein [Oscillospiraceae bacterium]